jgi:hypothetical protein
MSGEVPSSVILRLPRGTAPSITLRHRGSSSAPRHLEREGEFIDGFPCFLDLSSTFLAQEEYFLFREQDLLFHYLVGRGETVKRCVQTNRRLAQRFVVSKLKVGRLISQSDETSSACDIERRFRFDW